MVEKEENLDQNQINFNPIINQKSVLKFVLLFTIYLVINYFLPSFGILGFLINLVLLFVPYFVISYIIFRINEEKIKLG